MIRCAVAMCVLATAAASAQPLVYLDFDASLGTLPTAQCWDLVGSTSPAPSISNGELLMGPTSAAQTQMFSHALLFDFTRDTVVCEWDLQIVSSGYNANSCGTGQRAGWYAAVTDQFGRLVYCGVGSSNVFLSNNSAAFAGTNAPVIAFNATGSAHHYRLDMDTHIAQLSIDGTQVLSMPLGNTGVTTASQTHFGDLSVCQGSQSRLRTFRISLPPQCGVDFNRDCVADFFDYLDFVAAFAGQDPSADFNSDGVIDFFDYLDFVSVYAAGC